MKAKIISAAVLCVVCSHGDAQILNDLDRQQVALDMITDAAAQLCESPVHGGDDERAKLSGAAKVELNKLLKNLVDLGIDGAAEYETGKWKGVLQSDLAPLIEKTMECRLEVLTILNERMLPIAPRHPPDKMPTMLDALSNFNYEFGWSNAPRDTVDKRYSVFPITDVSMLNDDFAVLTYSRPQGDGILRVTLGERRLVGQWRDHEGEGEIWLVFDESLARGTGWWNRGGLTQQYNAFMRRVK